MFDLWGLQSKNCHGVLLPARRFLRFDPLLAYELRNWLACWRKPTENQCETPWMSEVAYTGGEFF